MIRYTRECLDAVNGHWVTGRPASRGRARARTIRVFQNPLLEITSRAHPITRGVWFGPFIAYAWVTAPGAVGWAATAGLFAAGMLGFSLFEYGLHRFVFHGLMRLAERDPRYRFAAFMALFALVYASLLGARLSVPLLGGTMAGYLGYDWIHYYTHHFRPRTRLGKWMRAYHLRHHYQDPNAFFGISSPLWDVVFGTFRSRRAREETAR